MKLLGWFAIGLLLGLFATAALAAEPKAKPLPNHEQARFKCKDAPPVMKHPADLEKAKREAFDSCLRSKGVHTRIIRPK
jgi:hypothetical protein